MFFTAVLFHPFTQDVINLLWSANCHQPKHRRCFVGGINSQITKFKYSVKQWPVNREILHPVEFYKIMPPVKDAKSVLQFPGSDFIVGAPDFKNPVTQE